MLKSNLQLVYNAHYFVFLNRLRYHPTSNQVKKSPNSITESIKRVAELSWIRSNRWRSCRRYGDGLGSLSPLHLMSAHRGPTWRPPPRKLPASEVRTSDLMLPHTLPSRSASRYGAVKSNRYLRSASNRQEPQGGVCIACACLPVV
jgi:hypothetical protein